MSFPKLAIFPASGSPAVLEDFCFFFFLHFNLYVYRKLPKKYIYILLLLVWICQAAKQVLDFYQGSGVSCGSESAHELQFHWRAGKTIQTTFCCFSPLGSADRSPLACRMHTHTYVHPDSLEIVTLGSAYQSTQPEKTTTHPPSLEKQERERKKRLTEGWQLSINRFLCCRAQSWWENVSCYLSPPTPLVFCLCLWFLAHTLSISLSPSLALFLPPSLMHRFSADWWGAKHTSSAQGGMLSHMQTDACTHTQTHAQPEVCLRLAGDVNKSSFSLSLLISCNFLINKNNCEVIEPADGPWGRKFTWKSKNGR